MKKVFTLLFVCSFAIQSFAVGVVTPSRKAADIYLPVGNTGKQISLLDLSKIDVNSFETLTGRHLDFVDKIGFKLAQRRLRNSIKPDGTVNNRRLNRYMGDGDHSTGFHIGGFALGFFVGIIGVLIAYLINDDFKHNRVKWAWIGFGIGFILTVVLLAAAVAAINRANYGY